ncbi:zinc ribbon domain-containing protein [Alkaliphilus transvaalensis]|uniref:hypothetical protein n=1 Tax=Alkaliphilus transvaalensis TaxID=114628 RepID=UPI00047AA446|nr:hypothetical protein [Alkaliphilus transvaalensis]
MSFIDKLSSSVSDTAKSLGKKSNELMEISKLNVSIRKREEEILKLFEELGQYVYGRLKRLNYISKSEAEATIIAIEKLEEEIKTLEKLILNIKKIKYCSDCEIEADDDARYCPTCGKYIGG